jgi:hypothetical protein
LNEEWASGLWLLAALQNVEKFKLRLKLPMASSQQPVANLEMRNLESLNL